MNVTKLVGAVVGILLLVIVFASSTVCIEAGHVGVVKTLGAVDAKELSEGFHFRVPFIQSVQQIDTRLKAHPVKANAASKDLQQVQTEIKLTYSMFGGMAAEAYRNVGTREQIDAAIIDPAIQESLKAVTAGYTAEQLVTQRETVKEAVQNAIRQFIANALEEKKLPKALSINQLAITDFDFSVEFNRSIESKVTAEQKALKAKNEKIRRITEAEAGAAEQRLAADAVAYQIEKESRARAAAIEREAQALSLNKGLIDLRAAERWDGVAPEFSETGQIPFVHNSAGK